jgi:putative transposase
MRKAFKYRLYANQKTFAQAEYWLVLCCFLYNCALEQRIWAYRNSRKTITYNEQQNELTIIRDEYSEYKDINVLVLRDVLRKLDHAYKAFFRRAKKKGEKVGFPRFKGKNRYDSFTLHKQYWKLDGKHLIIRNLGRFRLRLSRPIQGKIKAITIKRTPANKWYACFSCNDVPERKLPKSDKLIGIDVGIKSYLTDSDGNKVENPKFLKHALRELRVKQRKLSRAKKGSNNRKEAKLQVANCHEHVSNQRNDFLHKLANEYVAKYGVIKVENLQIQNMSQNHKLARDINDCSWGKFFELLSYKADEAGREVIKVPAKNTSRRCNVCGAINHDLKLSDRIWICQSCGAVHDRDINASKNIRDSEVWAEPSVVNVKQKFVRRPRIVDDTSANTLRLVINKSSSPHIIRSNITC